MQLPSIVHPKIVTIDGLQIRVVTYFPLTDAQAMKIAAVHVRNLRRLPSKKKVHVVMWHGDRDTAAML